MWVTLNGDYNVDVGKQYINIQFGLLGEQKTSKPA